MTNIFFSKWLCHHKCLFVRQFISLDTKPLRLSKLCLFTFIHRWCNSVLISIIILISDVPIITSCGGYCCSCYLLYKSPLIWFGPVCKIKIIFGMLDQWFPTLFVTLYLEVNKKISFPKSDVTRLTKLGHVRARSWTEI